VEDLLEVHNEVLLEVAGVLCFSEELAMLIKDLVDGWPL